MSDKKMRDAFEDWQAKENDHCANDFSRDSDGRYWRDGLAREWPVWEEAWSAHESKILDAIVLLKKWYALTLEDWLEIPDEKYFIVADTASFLHEEDMRNEPVTENVVVATTVTTGTL